MASSTGTTVGEKIVVTASLMENVPTNEESWQSNLVVPINPTSSTESQKAGSPVDYFPGYMPVSVSTSYLSSDSDLIKQEALKELASRLRTENSASSSSNLNLAASINSSRKSKHLSERIKPETSPESAARIRDFADQHFTPVTAEAFSEVVNTLPVITIPLSEVESFASTGGIYGAADKISAGTKIIRDKGPDPYESDYSTVKLAQGSAHLVIKVASKQVAVGGAGTGGGSTGGGGSEGTNDPTESLEDDSFKNPEDSDERDGDDYDVADLSDDTVLLVARKSQLLDGQVVYVAGVGELLEKQLVTSDDLILAISPLPSQLKKVKIVDVSNSNDTDDLELYYYLGGFDGSI